MREARELGDAGLVDVERVGVRQLEHAEADRLLAVEAQHDAVVLGAELDVADVVEADQRAVGARLESARACAWRSAFWSGRKRT